VTEKEKERALSMVFDVLESFLRVSLGEQVAVDGRIDHLLVLHERQRRPLARRSLVGRHIALPKTAPREPYVPVAHVVDDKRTEALTSPAQIQLVQIAAHRRGYRLQPA